MRLKHNSSDCKEPHAWAVWVVLFVSNFFRINQLRACRFHPSCSVYSTQAFRDFGFFNAFFLTAKRLLRCHPFSPGGYDPLPSSHKEGF